MVAYHCGPRDIDEWYLGELIDAHAMLPVHRRQAIADMAKAVRIGRLRKKSDYTKAIEELER